MTIYKIQIPGDKRDGLINIKENTSKVNIQYIPLTVGEQELSKCNLNRTWHFKEYGFDMSEPEFLNHLTHRAALKQFIESKEEWCCIIENNVSIELNLTEIKGEIGALEKDWDVFFPYDRFNQNPNKKISKLSSALINPNIREMRERQPYYLGFLWGSQVYFISKKGANLLYSNNDIKQRIEDEIFFQTERNKYQTYYDDFSWFNINKQEDFLPQERLNNIYNSVLNYNIWKPKALNIVRGILKKISDLANQLQIDLILQGGSHLGYIRHGGIMPWDDDIDIGIEEINLPKFLERIKNDANLSFDIFIESHTKTSYYKIWSKDGKKIKGYEYNYPFVDIWLYNKNGKDLIFKNGIICPNADLKPLIDIDFEGAKFKIPHNSIECLDTRYVDWKSNIRIYTWSHQKEKNSLLPLSAEIEVDANFRIKERRNH